MSEKLKSFLKSLGEDPHKRKRFEEDSEAVMEEHGLSEEHKQLVRGGDVEQLKSATGSDDAEAQFWVV